MLLKLILASLLLVQGSEIQTNEVQQLRIKEAYKDYLLNKEKLDKLFLQFLLQNADARRTSDAVNASLANVNAVIADTLKDIKADPNYSIDPTTGMVVKSKEGTN